MIAEQCFYVACAYFVAAQTAKSVHERLILRGSNSRLFFDPPAKPTVRANRMIQR